MKGICFTEPMFLATVEGRKTQTRRIINPQPDGDIYKNSFGYFDAHKGSKAKEYKPKYKVGETVYLKEPYCMDCDFIEDDKIKRYTTNGKILYKYAGDKISEFKKDSYLFSKWENKLFMPEKYARYFIKITGVRCERLQDINDIDCLREGIDNWLAPFVSSGIKINCYGIKEYHIQEFSLKEAYALLIDKINGKGAWDSNPYVWVYSFVLKK